jgi:hypothetical protein
MPRGIVGLLAAVGATMSSLVAFAHGDLVWLTIVDAAVATGLAAYLALPRNKKTPRNIPPGSAHIPDGILRRLSRRSAYETAWEDWTPIADDGRAIVLDQVVDAALGRRWMFKIE